MALNIMLTFLLILEMLKGITYKYVCFIKLFYFASDDVKKYYIKKD